MDTPKVESPRSNDRWRHQTLVGTMLRGLLALFPSIVTAVVVLSLVKAMPDEPAFFVGGAWLLGIAIAGFATATIIANATTRLLPLAALLKLSLIFPDQAPNRLRLAMKASSSRRLKREVREARANGLSSDVTTAAEQVLLLTTALGEHDRRTRGHSERVRLFSRMIGEEIGLNDEELERLQWGALLHDIGKLTVPSQILNKAGSPTEVEWAILKNHPGAGGELIDPLRPFLEHFAAAADGHHEKWDGSGYPNGLVGADIPVAARIVAVADAYEVLTSVRAYKKPMSAESARAELMRSSGTHFDPTMVRALFNVSVGQIRWATGPVALAMGLPLVGPFVGLLARAGFHLTGTPAAAASIAPATATAGAMSVAAATGGIPIPQTLPMFDPVGVSVTDHAIQQLPEPSDTILVPESTSTTRPAQAASRTESSETSTTTASTVPPSSTTTPSTVPVTIAPSTSATPTTSTTVPSTTTTAAPTTTTPSTTIQPTTTTAAPTTTTMPVPVDVFDKTIGPPVVVSGPLVFGDDLGNPGPFTSDGTAFLFRGEPMTLPVDLLLDGNILARNTRVCVDYFHVAPMTVGFADELWQIKYNAPVLAVASSGVELLATDFLHGPGVFFGPGRQLSGADSIQVTEEADDEDPGDEAEWKVKVRATTEAGAIDAVRVIIACD